MKQFIRKADIILLIVLVIAGLAASAALSMSRSAAGSDAEVIIESGGELYASYPLSEDRTVIVPSPQEKSAAILPDDSRPASEQFTHYNVVTISGGKVSVSEASCKNQVCVHHAGISQGGESIVCLPNRLVVRIDPGSGKGGGYDSVTS